MHEDQIYAGKRARLTIDTIGEDCEMEEFSPCIQDDEASFEDVCGDATFPQKAFECSEPKDGSWGQLDGHILARIFHFLRADMKSLVVAGSTCKQWRAATGFYKDVSRLVDLSSIGINCTDHLVRNIMVGLLSFLLFL